jgi:Holliday junction resolvasome RuvABC endonuclease subunit
VRNFSETNEKLMANLQRIELAIEKSMTRSDEQLAYYVAQAREMIDLSIGSQKDVLEALQQRQSEGAA